MGYNEDQIKLCRLILLITLIQNESLFYFLYLIYWNLNISSTFYETLVPLSYDFSLNTIIIYVRFLSWPRLCSYGTMHYTSTELDASMFYNYKHNHTFKIWILPIFKYYFSDINIIMTTRYVFLSVESSNLCNYTKCGTWSTGKIKPELMITSY